MTDRIFGMIILVVALAFVASATQIEIGFLPDPLGSKAFPMLVGGIAIVAALVVVLRPDPEPGWPALLTFGKLGFAAFVLVIFAYSLRPFGFLIPTALASGVLSYQIQQRPLPAALTGVGMSVGLFVIFRFALGLGLDAFPRSWFG